MQLARRAVVHGVLGMLTHTAKTAVLPKKIKIIKKSGAVVIHALGRAGDIF